MLEWIIGIVILAAAVFAVWGLKKLLAQNPDLAKVMPPVMMGIEMAEKAIPDDTPNAILHRIDQFLKTFKAEYTAQEGKPPKDAVVDVAMDVAKKAFEAKAQTAASSSSSSVAGMILMLVLSGAVLMMAAGCSFQVVYNTEPGSPSGSINQNTLSWLTPWTPAPQAPAAAKTPVAETPAEPQQSAAAVSEQHRPDEAVLRNPTPLEEVCDVDLSCKTGDLAAGLSD